MYQQFTMLGSCLIQNTPLHTAAIVFTLTFSSLSHLPLWCSRASSNSTSLEESDTFLAPENSCHFPGFLHRAKPPQGQDASSSLESLHPTVATGCSPACSPPSWILLPSLNEVGIQATGNDSPVAQETVLAQSYHCCTSLVFSMPHRVVLL